MNLDRYVYIYTFISALPAGPFKLPELVYVFIQQGPGINFFFWCKVCIVYHMGESGNGGVM